MVSQLCGLAPSLISVLRHLSFPPRLPACDLSSSSTRTSLPLFGLRLPRSHHSEEWWQDPWALSGLSFSCHSSPLELGTQIPGKTSGQWEIWLLDC